MDEDLDALEGNFDDPSKIVVGDDEGDETDSDDLQEEVAVDLTSEDTSTDSSEDEQDGEERRKFGQRAEKRISKLVKQRNEWQEKYAAMQAQLQEVSQSAETQARTSVERQVADQSDKLDEQERRLQREHRDAVDEGDIDKQWEITRNIARIEAQRLALNTYKARMERGAPKEAPQEARERRETRVQAPVIDPQTQVWASENSWFGKETHKDQTRVAMEIDQALIAEGYDPSEPPEPGEKHNEYFTELNLRLNKQFPPQRGGGKSNPVAPASRTGGRRKSGNTVTLTPRERERARNLGVSEAAYAREKLKIEQRDKL